MREIHVESVSQAVRDLCIRANTELGADVIAALEKALDNEASPIGRDIIERLIENARIAKDEQIPMCQDTGMAVVYLEAGQEVQFVGGSLEAAIHEGVRQGYADGYLRKSLCDPITRKNTGDNTPGMIHYRIVPGEGCRLTVAPKGGGGENMSQVVMLSPSEGIQTVCCGAGA